MLLTGTFVRALDDKQRFAIPKRLRDAMLDSPGKKLFMTRGTDASLAIYTEEVLAGVAQRMAAASPVQQDVRDFQRLFYAQAEQLDVDSQGRVRIPPALAQLAGVSKEIVLLGVLDHLELWDRSRWESYLAERTGQYDALAVRAFDAGQSPPVVSTSK